MPHDMPAESRHSEAKVELAPPFGTRGPAVQRGSVTEAQRKRCGMSRDIRQWLVSMPTGQEQPSLNVCETSATVRLPVRAPKAITARCLLPSVDSQPHEFDGWA